MKPRKDWKPGNPIEVHQWILQVGPYVPASMVWRVIGRSREFVRQALMKQSIRSRVLRFSDDFEFEIVELAELRRYVKLHGIGEKHHGMEILQVSGNNFWDDKILQDQELR